jgi:hypothetical protein
MAEVPDREFVDTLRAAVRSYLETVDRWEAAYSRYYRMPGSAPLLSADMEPLQRDYETQRRALELLAPRAHRLCLKHRLQNPIPGLLRVSLGAYAPQQRIDSAIGRSERNAVTECLMQLADACSGWTPEFERSAEELPDASRSFGGLRRGTAILAWILCALAIVGLAIVRRRAPARHDQPSRPHRPLPFTSR